MHYRKEGFVKPNYNFLMYIVFQARREGSQRAYTLRIERLENRTCSPLHCFCQHRLFFRRNPAVYISCTPLISGLGTHPGLRSAGLDRS